MLQRAYGTPQKRDDDLIDTDSDDEEDVKFPTKEELALLPQNMQATLMGVVYETIKKALLPRLEFLVARRKRRVEEILARNMSPLPTAQFLLSLSIFSKWSNVEEVFPKLTLKIIRPNEVLQFERDPIDTVWFLTSGSLQCRQKRPDALCKGHPDRATTRTRVLEGLRVINEKVFFTEEKAGETVKGLTRCTVFGLSRSSYLDLLGKQAPEKQDAIQAACFATRRDLMFSTTALDAKMLQSMAVFRSVPSQVLELLLLRLEPRVYSAGQQLCVAGAASHEALLVARGTVSVTVKSNPEARTAGRGSIWGEVATLFVKKGVLNVTAVTTCDVFSLSREAMTAILGSAGVMGDVLRAAHKLELEWEAEANTQHLPFICSIPFLQHVCGDSSDKFNSLVNTMLEQLLSCVYPANTAIVSSSEACDRLIIPIRGRARIGTLGIDLMIGEAIGFTCLVPHRWRYYVAASEPVQSLELPKAAFRAVLQQYDVLNAYEALTQGLLFPNVLPQVFSTAVHLLSHYANPALFSCSQASVMTSLEPRLSHQHPFTTSEFHTSKKPSRVQPINELRPPIQTQAVDSVEEWECPRPKAERWPRKHVDDETRAKELLAGSPAVRHLREMLMRAARAEEPLSQFSNVADEVENATGDRMRAAVCADTHAVAISAPVFADRETQTDRSFVSDVWARFDAMMK